MTCADTRKESAESADRRPDVATRTQRKGRYCSIIRNPARERKQDRRPAATLDSTLRLRTCSLTGLWCSERRQQRLLEGRSVNANKEKNTTNNERRKSKKCCGWASSRSINTPVHYRTQAEYFPTICATVAVFRHFILAWLSLRLLTHTHLVAHSEIDLLAVYALAKPRPTSGIVTSRTSTDVARKRV